MDSDRDYYGGPVPLPGSGGGQPAGPGAPPTARRDGIRRARRVSNWTAAGLIAATGVAAVALAQQPRPGTPVHATSAAGSTAAAATEGVTSAARPQVSHSVATTSGSGVTTTTTTRRPHGIPVVTNVRHTAPYQDS